MLSGLVLDLAYRVSGGGGVSGEECSNVSDSLVLLTRRTGIIIIKILIYCNFISLNDDSIHLLSDHTYYKLSVEFVLLQLYPNKHLWPLL